MVVTLWNDWYLSSDLYIGTNNTTGITAEQQHNATKIYNFLTSEGWTLNAIAGLLGNAQFESTLNPACVYPESMFPNNAASLADIDNSIALPKDNAALGMVQWKGHTDNAPAGHKLVSYAERHNLNWYDGDTQLSRWHIEVRDGYQFTPQAVDGVYWTWQTYINSTGTPETLAKVFAKCYEGDPSAIATRQSNARYWYEYFQNTPPTPPTPTPTDWITGHEFAQLALAYNGQYLPYSQYDCIGYVNLVWRDIPVVHDNNWNLTNGTNSIWRSSRTFNTVSPIMQNPTPELWYQDTIANCAANYGTIPEGALLFHKISDEGPPPIPPEYAGDGIGNFVHVGIYVGNGQVMQSGGQDSGSIPGGGVHLSNYDPSAWNYVAFVVYVDCTGEIPPEPPEPEFTPWWMAFFINNLGGVKRVRHF